jgi:hypothetical protein
MSPFKLKPTLLALAIIGKSCVGCGPVPQHETNVLTTLATPITVDCIRCDRSVMEDAINQWNAGTGMKAFELSNGIAPPFVMITIVQDVPGPDQGYAVLYPDRCAIDIEGVMMHRWWLMMHEMGHCLGFDHSSNPTSMMYKNTNYKSEITPEIIEILETLINSDNQKGEI